MYIGYLKNFSLLFFALFAVNVVEFNVLKGRAIALLQSDLVFAELLLA